MAVTRLSKLQESVLGILCGMSKPWMHYGELKWAVHERKNGQNLDIDKVFVAAFSRSIRSLIAKGLVEVETVNVHWNLPLLEYIEFWIYYENSSHRLATKKEIASKISTPEELAKMTRVPQFFEETARINRVNQKRYRVTILGRDLLRSRGRHLS